jgi:hypothetical protein
MNETAQMVAFGGAAAASVALLGKFNGSVANVLNTFVSSSFSMSKAATSGAASLTDMGAAVGQVAGLFPGLGAAFASVLNTAISTLEKNITTQQALSNVGATFVGSLSTLRDTANKTYLSMDQFGKVVGANADVLASFKGGVQGGTKAFSDVLASLQRQGSDTGNMMANLGIGFEEAAQLTAQFMRGQGNMNRTGQMSADQLAKATADYAAELTGLSDLTGQSRKALAEKVNEEMAEAQFQNFLNTLDPKEAAKLQEAVAIEFAATGKAGADALKASAAGFPPMTKASQMFTATQESSVERQRELMSKIKDSSVDLDTFRVQSKQILANSLEGMKEDQKKIATVAMAGVLSGGSELSKSVEAITKLLNTTYGKSVAEINEMLSKPRITAPQTSEATIGMDQQRAIIKSSNEALKSMQPILDLSLRAGTQISEVLNGTAKAISTRLPAIISYIDSTVKTIGPAVGSMVGKTMSPDQLMEKVGQTVDKAGSEIKKRTDAVLSGDKNQLNTLYNDMKAGWDSVIKHIKDSIPSLNSIIFGGPPTPGGTNRPGGQSSSSEKNIVDRLEEIKNYFKAAVESMLPGPPSTSPAPTLPGRVESSASPTPRLPGRAEGGATTPGSYIVGEEGPEVVNLGTRGDVINNDNLTAMISALSNQNNMGESIDQLNNTNSQMLSAIRDLIDISKRNLTATKGLNGNLFAA